MTGRVPVHHLESDWIIRSFVDEVRVSGFYDLTKRLLDFLGGLVGTVIMLAFLPFISVAILIDSGRPIFYSQIRLGRGAAKFTIYKFRTMKQNAEQDGEARLAEKNDPRITRVGDFLRKTRLDELPQFWNILRGEMSLVGPRAERPELIAEFQKQVRFYRARLLVKPGLTGWAQINYGYYASVTEMSMWLEPVPERTVSSSRSRRNSTHSRRSVAASAGTGIAPGSRPAFSESLTSHSSHSMLRSLSSLHHRGLGPKARCAK